MIQAFVDFFQTPFKIGDLVLFFSPLEALLQFVLPITLVLVIYKLLLFLVSRLILKPLKVNEELKNNIYRYTRLVLRALALVALIFVITGFFGKEIQNYIRAAWQVLRSPLLSAGNSRVTIITIILAIPIFYLSAWLGKATKKLVDATVLNRMGINEATKFTISTLVRYAVLILVLLIGLSIIGINLSSLTVLFGVLGIGVGFGLQNIVSNFFSGLVIIFERPIKEGDRILVNGLVGDVEHIRLRSTIINTLTNETIIVPNSQLVQNQIHNYSYVDKRIVIVSSVQVAYSTDLDQAEAVLLSIAGNNPYGLQRPQPMVLIKAFEDSGILLELWCWIKNATDKLVSESWTNMEIWRAFKSAGIVIPFPQADVHIVEPVHLSGNIEGIGV